VFGVAAATFVLTALLMNIQERKQEAQSHFFPVANLDEDTLDPKVWGRNFPRQYEGYVRTVDVERTRYGGSENFSKLEEDPRLKVLYAGYAFAIDHREERGHAYMLQDQKETERVRKVKQPGACLHCHASVMPAYRKAGNGDELEGFKKVCGMDWSDAVKLVTHPVTCVDCHDPKTSQLRVTRPAFKIAIQDLANSDDPLPHFASIERWRKADRDAWREKNDPERAYRVNELATRQELRTFVCAQCHVEYYFQGDKKLLTYPWHNGLKVEDIERYYDELKGKDGKPFKDWTHQNTGAEVLKAQHPEFELWNQGIHARSGVACADCHMPYKREGAIKITDHHVRSPMLGTNVARACQTCHRFPEDELRARVDLIQDRTSKLLTRAEDALIELIRTVEAGKKQVPADVLAAAHQLHRKAQWRVDFVGAENSMGFHAPQESARILGEAIDYSRQGQVLMLKNAKR
jgi:nitrite reductase (cytochrome c-552)